MWQNLLQPESDEFYPKSDHSDDSEDDDDDEDGSVKISKKKTYIMDPDHRLLLRSCKPLLQSRNAAVSFVIHKLFELSLRKALPKVCWFKFQKASSNCLGGLVILEMKWAFFKSFHKKPITAVHTVEE